VSWLIYGANGYTGRLIAQEAKALGLAPILAGRNAEALKALAGELGFEHRAFGLGAEELRRGLDGVTLVLHCAGPFSATCAPMLEACLAQRVHYLDITGEIDVFAHCHAQDARARQAGVVVLPGAGFDVVPTDCTAALLKQDLPDATHLVLAFDAGGGLSPGTAKTSIEGLGKGGRVRIDGVLTRVPLGWKARTFERPPTSVAPASPRTAVTIPWGDVYTSYVSTGIPNVEVYTAVPPATVARLRRLRWFGPLLRTRPVQAWLKSRVERSVRGPSESRRAASESIVWGEVCNADGQRRARRLRVPNGYDLTVTAALGIVARLLREVPAGGYYTPSKLMGPGYVLTLPGVVEL
jgi:short subunit dehydrogenase-like uncharacterized protein